MEISEQIISVSKNARVFSIGIPAHLAKKCWLVFHGYGQDAAYFLRKMAPLLEEDMAILAPEGLSKFYLSGLSGRVGASWMTKESRELEIQDQLNFVDLLLEKFQIEASVELNILGFSQGASVAARWYMQSARKVKNMVIWGAGLPLETTAEMALKFNECNTLFMLGKKDQFLEPAVLESHFSKLDALHFQHQRLFYDGGHKVDLDSIQLLKSHLK